MIDSVNMAVVFCFLTGIVVVFQFALVLGAPWGELTMGGKYPGKFSSTMRVMAIVQMGLLVFIAMIVLTRSRLAFEGYYAFSEKAIWGVVVFCAIGLVLNLITPSKKERRLWAPVSVVLLICAVAVAIS